MTLSEASAYGDVPPRSSLQAIAGALRSHPRATISVPGRRQAAVLILCYERDGEPWVVLTKRHADLREHAGEISFPGGARDGSDEDLWTTAVRETFEELGVEPATVTQLGALDDYPTFSSRFIVAPFVGAVDEPPMWVASEAEIGEVIELPLSKLWREYRREMWERGGATFPMHVFEVDGHYVWGLTAFILRHFLDLVAPALGLEP